MKPGTILHDSQFLCYDGTVQNKLLVVLNDATAGYYTLVKTTSEPKGKGRNLGCQPRDHFRNFFISAGQSSFPKDTWIMLNEFYEASPQDLAARISAGHLYDGVGYLDESLLKTLLVCAKESLDITPQQEIVLDDTLTVIALF
jgi:hypothetical protein